jgi:PTS system mannose-specific IIC component
VALVGGLISLDRTAVGQFMVSRPIVVAPLTGWICGDVTTGVLIGGVLELMWIGRPPLGGFIPPHECLTAIVVTAAVCLSAPSAAVEPGVPRSLVSLALLIGLPFGRLGVTVEKAVRRQNDRWARRAVADVSLGRVPPLMRYNLYGLATAWAALTLFILVCGAAFTLVLLSIAPLLPAWAHRGLGFMFFLLPALGVASSLSTLNVAKSHLIFIVCFFGAFLLSLL